MSQSQLDALFVEGAAQLFKEYLDDQIKDEAVEDQAVLAEAKELGLLPMAISDIVDLTKEDPADQSVQQIEQSALRKIHVAVRLLSEVLQPQIFKSDWRVKFEKKRATKKNNTAKYQYGGSKSAHHEMQQIRNENKKRVLDAQNKDWKVGGFVKREKNAAMTDNAM